MWPHRNQEFKKAVVQFMAVKSDPDCKELEFSLSLIINATLMAYFCRYVHNRLMSELASGPCGVNEDCQT